MILIPVGTAAMLALFPAEFLQIPLVVWVVWLLFSVWVALDAPLRVEWFIPPHRLSRSPRYGKLGITLGVANVAWSTAVLVYLGWWA